MKKAIHNLLRNPFFRGIVKTIPIIGTPLVEVITNVTTEKDKYKKHDWKSIATQIVIAGVLIYLVISKTISLDEFIAKIFLVSGK